MPKILCNHIQYQTYISITLISRNIVVQTCDDYIIKILIILYVSHLFQHLTLDMTLTLCQAIYILLFLNDTFGIINNIHSCLECDIPYYAINDASIIE